MKNTVSYVKRFLREEEGVTAIEYGLLAALIAVGIIVAATLVGDELEATFNDVAAALQNR